MDLASYMERNGLTDTQLAELVNRSRSNITRWRRKKTRPDIDALVALERLTEGAVTAKDFAREVTQ